MNMNIQIITDSASDLPKEILKKYTIHVIPLAITHQGKAYSEGIDLSREQFKELLLLSEEIPKTSQPSLGAFLEVYNRLHHEDPNVEIISIHLSEKLSGTVQTARMAAELSDANVTVVDSGFLSIALGFQVIKAATLAIQKKSTVDEIISELSIVKEGTSLYCALDTLDFLVKGGRIHKGKAMIGSILKIKPIACLSDAEYTPVKAVRTQKQVNSFFKDTFLMDSEGKIVEGIAIVHVYAEKQAHDLYAELREILPHSCEVLITEASTVISTHTGPGAIGLMYYVK